LEENKGLNQPEELVFTWTEQPKEVVLRYEAPLPHRSAPSAEEVPPPRDWGMEPPEVPKTDETPAPRRRRWPWILAGVLCAALLVGLGVAAAYSAVSLWQSISGFRAESGVDEDYDPAEEWEKEFEDGYRWEMSERERETNLPTYPLGGDFRLTYREDHGPELTPQEIYETVNPAVVAVVNYSATTSSVGTGVILSSDGYVLTNYHVISGGEECYILLSDGSYYPVRLVAGDYAKDLAVLKADAQDLPVAEFGDSDGLVVGDTVYAIGNPLGLELRGTLTDGLISAINRDVDVDGITMTLIQTNAALNSGNSGGPLINAYGQVVGINTIKMVSNYEDDALEGLGFAIPISSGAFVVNSLIQYGEVRPEPVLGIMVEQILTLLEDGTGGLRITEVTPDLGGHLAGIQPGDYIIAADGDPVATTNDIYRARRRYGEGEELPLTIWRNGEQLEVLVPLMVEE